MVGVLVESGRVPGDLSEAESELGVVLFSASGF